MVLTAYSVLSPATNSSCHRRRRIDGSSRPGRVKKTSASLTPATGARTTRLCRTQMRRSSTRHWSLTGNRPATSSRDGAAASTASLPAFVTIAKRPSCRGGMARAGSADLPDGESEIFFASGMDRKMPDGQIRCWGPQRWFGNAALYRARAKATAIMIGGRERKVIRGRIPLCPIEWKRRAYTRNAVTAAIPVQVYG
jgi:hypothetical protein